ncbi:MAG: hypothetical protein K8S27_14750 [Candidatus Omnitrophica bacterium]|nr:hypothetical protein [Candidatus Omnitrophota bacterium]
MQKKLFLLSVLFLSIFSLTGCIETKQHYILNPDGSGKVDYQIKMAVTQFGMGPTETGAARVRGMAKDIISNSEGVAVWKDIAFEQEEDQRISFNGIAYFDDVNELNINQGGFSSTMMQILFTRNPAGGATLELRNETTEPEVDRELSAAMMTELSEEEVAEKIKKERQSYQQMKPMLTGTMMNIKIDMQFRLPDPEKTFTNFERLDNGDLRVVFDGQKFFEVIDQLIQDDEWLRENVMKGRQFAKEGPEMDDELNAFLYGEKAPIKVMMGSDARPLFDYEAEVGQAKSQYNEHLKSLGLGSLIPIPQAQGGNLKSLKVGGVRIIHYSDTQNNIRPFNYDKGFAFSLIGQLPGAVLSVEKGNLIKAVADNGESLLPESDFSRTINFFHLSGDKSQVIFDVNLELPAGHVQTIALIEGELVYHVAGPLKQVDLGITRFAAGVRGTALGALVQSVKPSDWEKGQHEFSLELDFPASAVKEAFFYDSDGKKLNVRQNMTSTVNGVTTITFSLDHPYPAEGRVELSAYDDLKQYRIPFRLENIDLLGRPVAVSKPLSKPLSASDTDLKKTGPRSSGPAFGRSNDKVGPRPGSME